MISRPTLRIALKTIQDKMAKTFKSRNKYDEDSDDWNMYNKEYRKYVDAYNEIERNLKQGELL